MFDGGVTMDIRSTTSVACFWPFSGGRSFWQAIRGDEDNDEAVSSGGICLGREGNGG